jgi:hypothetical protein
LVAKALGISQEANSPVVRIVENCFDNNFPHRFYWHFRLRVTRAHFQEYTLAQFRFFAEMAVISCYLQNIME